jgi:hypothetical protein
MKMAWFTGERKSLLDRACLSATSRDYLSQFPVGKKIG